MRAWRGSLPGSLGTGLSEYRFEFHDFRCLASSEFTIDLYQSSDKRILVLCSFGGPVIRNLDSGDEAKRPGLLELVQLIHSPCLSNRKGTIVVFSSLVYSYNSVSLDCIVNVDRVSGYLPDTTINLCFLLVLSTPGGGGDEGNALSSDIFT